MNSPEKIRTFLAAYPDSATLAILVRALAPFRDRTTAIRWSPEDQLHFTLRFFGDLDVESRRRAVDVLETLTPRLKPVLFPLNGLGAFPNWRRPRVIWAGAGAGAEDLENVARRIDVAFNEAGLGRADKAFKAHLTIGRLREGKSLEAEVQRDLESCPFVTPPFRIETVHLMASRLGPGGATHTPLCDLKLG